MVVLESLVVGKVAGRDQVNTVQTRPGKDRPTRLVAWMYSAVFLGWPLTTIRPRRFTSTPTDKHIRREHDIDGPRFALEPDACHAPVRSTAPVEFDSS